MKPLFTLSAIVFSLVLAGCSNNKPEPPTQKVVQTKVIKADNGASLNVESYEQLRTETHQPTDVSLRYITRADTSKIVALKTLTFIMGTLAGGAQESGFTKDQLVGTPITSLPNPSLAFFNEGIEKSLQPLLASKPAWQSSHPLQILPYTWMLVYENLSGGENYELHYLTTIVRDKDNAKNKFDYASVSCSPTPVKAPLAEWEANNYQKVTDVTRRYMDACMQEFEQKKEEFLQ